MPKAAAVIAAILLSFPWMLKAEAVAQARIDLRNYGYRVTGENINVLDYTTLAFLSDNVVVVGINQGMSGNPYFGGVAGRINRKHATLIAVDLSSGHITGPVGIPLLTTHDTIKAIAGRRLAAITAGGVRICDSSLECVSTSIPGLDPLRVSAQGKVMAVGGYRETATKIFDTVTLKQLAVYESGVAGTLQTVIPGDTAVLLSQGEQASMRRLEGSLISRFPTAPGIALRSLRFLDLRYAGAFFTDRQRAVIFGLDGSKKYDLPIGRADLSHFLTCLDGKRFGIYEHGYTSLNALEHFGDIEKTRPENFARVRVFELATGVKKALIEWDPLSRSTEPALSPNGSKIARIRGGYLEVVTVD